MPISLISMQLQVLQKNDWDLWDPAPNTNAANLLSAEDTLDPPLKVGQPAAEDLPSVNKESVRSVLEGSSHDNRSCTPSNPSNDGVRNHFAYLPSEIKLLCFKTLVTIPRVVYVIEIATFPTPFSHNTYPEHLEFDCHKVSKTYRFKEIPSQYRLYTPCPPPTLSQVNASVRHLALGQNSLGNPLLSTQNLYSEHYELSFKTKHSPPQIYFNFNSDILLLTADSFFDRQPARWGGPRSLLEYKYDPKLESFDPQDLAGVKSLALQWLEEFGTSATSFHGLNRITRGFPNLKTLFLVVGEKIDRNQVREKQLQFVEPREEFKRVTSRIGMLRPAPIGQRVQARRASFDLGVELKSMKALLNMSRKKWLAFEARSAGTLIEEIVVVEVRVAD